MSRIADRRVIQQRSNSTVRLATASAFAASTMVGMVAPAAFADVGEAPKDLEAATNAVLAPKVVKASLNTPAEGEWEFEAVTVDTEEAPAVAVTVDGRAGVNGAPAATPGTGAAGVASARPVAVQAASGIVGIARAYAGSPYVYGGSSPAGFDCSGFTSFVYAQAGISLPRSSAAQLSAGQRVSAAEAQPGDLVWWPGHVGIYTGNGQHIAARNPSSGVMEGPVYGNPVYVRIG
ncbi:C40 family peptidase [Trueperella pecoris]|nr:C40 family peptidase [Trueperella pecoris]